MKKLVPALVTFFTASVILTGCGQEKVIDTDFVRLQNKVKDMETAQKQKDDEMTKLNQKISDINQTLTKQNQQISTLMSAQNVKDTGIHPVVIQDVKINSDKMDQKGRVFGPFNVNVTLYNGTDHDINDTLSTIVLSDSSDTPDTPKTQNLDQKFSIKAKESKTITIQNIPVGQPTQRLNLIIKLMETAGSTEGVPGKATWIEVPSVILPPSS